MKRLIFLILITVVITSGCQSSYQPAPLSDLTINESIGSSYTPESIGIQTIVESADTHITTLHYPVLGYEKIDSEIKNFIDNRHALYTQEVAAIESSTETLELHLEYEIVNRTQSYVSILFKERKYLGGVQNNVTFFTFNYSTASQSVLALEDLFDTTAYLSLLSDLSYTLLINENIVPTAVDINWIKGGLYPVDKNFSNFLFNSDHLTLLFNKYQLGPAFIGTPNISIPYDTLEEYLPLKESLINALKPDSANPDNRRVEVLPALPGLSPEKDPQTAKGKSIALTFDLGPHPVYTPIILDTLERNNAKASFFLLGNHVADYGEIARRIVKEGHLIGNMTYSHPLAIRLTAEEFSDQITRAQDQIVQHTGVTPYMIRPPFGAINDTLITTSDHPFILWSIDPQDLIFNDSDYIVSYVLDHAFDGAIIRLHDNSSSTTQAIGPLIEGLQNAGYSLVTLDELLDLDADQTQDSLKTYYRAIH